MMRVLKRDVWVEQVSAKLCVVTEYEFLIRKVTDGKPDAWVCKEKLRRFLGEGDQPTGWKVWSDTKPQLRQSIKPSDLTLAETNKGLVVHLRVNELESISPVWVNDGKKWMSVIDPQAWVNKRMWILMALILGIVIWHVSLCYLFAVSPLFGTWSTVGAIIGLATFLLLQPVAMRVQNDCKLPFEQRFMFVEQFSET